MRSQPPVKCHCGNMARYYDPVGAWRCVECRCFVNSAGRIRIAKCDTGLDELRPVNDRMCIEPDCESKPHRLGDTPHSFPPVDF